MIAYDPEVAPNPVQRLGLSEFQRLERVSEFHRRRNGFGESLESHAAVHVIVENQLALREPVEAVEAVLRLQTMGLCRHDAVHAIATVLAEHISSSAQGTLREKGVRPVELRQCTSPSDCGAMAR